MKIFLIIFLCAINQQLIAQGIRGKILDSSSQTPLPSRIVITDDTGRVYNSYYSKLKGFFTEEDGTFFQELKNGTYTLEVFRGIDYLSQKIKFSISNNVM